ncbi:VENN motif pre-toxin domain-containing protein [Limnobaculum parvum]|uniref:Uncharacterized protein n=1 Tax=Limnobaculum parvum TaxID=2172103 RepID=A0A2Y9U044_9GAMM|nr:VENN motif pre-toxin domain-containing protein [Limnobaculum parvum]AWH89386.1 hypothetical protein HYN51_13000 [Limnobaculum parvum]
MAYGDSASSTTHAAIADGTLTICDTDQQKQDISRISHDTENAANPRDKIFDADEQMRNLEAIGLAGQIVSQVTTIATNIGVMNAQDQARAEADANKDAASKDPAIVAQARADLAKAGNENPTQEDLNKATYAVIYQASYDKFYEKEMEFYGTGSNVGRAIQAAGAALTVAIGGGSAGNAAAAASAPLLAQGVKKLADTNFPIDEEHPNNANLFAKVIGHAIVGLAVAEGSGNNGLSGALGAASGELIAKTIAEDLYHKKTDDLTEAERQFIANMTSIATGVAAGLVADNTADAGTAAAAAYNSSVNNYLSPSKSDALTKALEEQKAGENLVKASTDIVQLMDEDKYTNGLVHKLQQGQELTESERQSLAGSLNEYGLDLQLNYGYTKEQAAAAIQSILTGNSFFAPPTDVGAYNEAYRYLARAGSTNSLAKIGNDVLLGLSGAPGKTGAIARYALEAGGAYQVGYGVGELSDGHYGAGAWDIGLGLTTFSGSVAYGMKVNAISPDSLVFRANQAEHLATLDGFTQKSGIGGAHNAIAFYEVVNQYNVKILPGTRTIAPGISEVKYQVPAKHPQTGEITGYKAKVETKTIYDPNIYSDQTILELGKQAAASGYKNARSKGQQAYDAKAGGITFRVYLDKKTGKVTNFHPK